MFYIANEGLSILENAGRIGLPMPEALKGALVKLKDGKNDTAEGK
jgi:phage-related holin